MPKLAITKYLKIKQGLLEGQSYKDAMLNAGLSKHTASVGVRVKAIQTAVKSIQDDFKLSDITVEYVIAKLQHIVETARHDSDKTAALALLGKYLSLWTDRIKSEVDVSTNEKLILEQYTQVPITNRVTTSNL